MICPNCRQDAPTITRGLGVYCTACGAQRSILNTSTPVNVAGKTGKVGGTVAGVVGWIILLVGLLVALTVGGLFQAIFPTAIIGYILGGFLGGISLLAGLGLIFGGKKLRQTGNVSERNAREEAVLAIAARRGGSITAADLAKSISIPEAEADALLTEMAKRPDGRVTLEVDDDGALRYEVRDLMRPRRARVVDAIRSRVQAPQNRIDPRDEDEALAEDEAARADASAQRRRER